MLFSVVSLIVSTALLMFYLQLHCQRILRREFDDDAVVNANRLEHMASDAIIGWRFPFVRKALEEFDVPVDYERVCMQLKCDFLALTYLRKNGCNAKRRLSKDERLLRMYFRAVFSLLWIRHRMGLSEKAGVLKLTSILEYFRNALGERRVWRAEIDVMVEDNGTVFLAYPLTDAAWEWFDMNISRNTQRLGDIQFVEPCHLYDLVEAMLDSDLRVAWSSGSLILRNIPRKAREKSAGSVRR
jgi:hypothetical protein